MSIIRLMNRIYMTPKLCCDIILFYNKLIVDYSVVRRETFIGICRENHLDIYPSLLFNFFDSIGIKIAILPINNTEFWSSRIYHDGSVTISSDYVGRSEATIGALEWAIVFYENKNENKKINETE